MNVLVVLSHLMSNASQLGEESIARAELAIDMFSCGEYDTLVTLGWDYREDCKTPIADVMSDYIQRHSNIAPSSIITIHTSRDTVGDAVFSFDCFRDAQLTKIDVVTSDYHVYRARCIFRQVFNNMVPVDVYGAPTPLHSDPKTLQHEKQSLEAFFQTFIGVDFSSFSEVFTVLCEKHPYYNGQIHPKFRTLDC